jgi:hypothetical protein
VAVMSGLADVQAQEHAHVFDPEHRALPRVLTAPASARVSISRIHVMQTCRPRTARRCAGPDGGRTSDQRLRRTPPGPGDTPQVIDFDRGTQSCRARRPAGLAVPPRRHPRRRRGRVTRTVRPRYG